MTSFYFTSKNVEKKYSQFFSDGFPVLLGLDFDVVTEFSFAMTTSDLLSSTNSIATFPRDFSVDTLADFL